MNNIRKQKNSYENFKIEVFILLCLIIFYYKIDSEIMNFSIYKKLFLYVVVLITYFLSDIFLIKSGKEFIDNIVRGSNIYILILFVISFLIILNSNKNKSNFYKTDIIQYIGGRTNKIYFNFKNEEYSVKFRNNERLSKPQIESDYNIVIEHKPSIFDTYVIVDVKLEENE